MCYGRSAGVHEQSRTSVQMPLHFCSVQCNFWRSCHVTFGFVGTGHKGQLQSTICGDPSAISYMCFWHDLVVWKLHCVAGLSIWPFCLLSLPVVIIKCPPCRIIKQESHVDLWVFWRKHVLGQECSFINSLSIPLMMSLRLLCFTCLKVKTVPATYSPRICHLRPSFQYCQFMSRSKLCSYNLLDGSVDHPWFGLP